MNTHGGIVNRLRLDAGRVTSLTDSRLRTAKDAFQLRHPVWEFFWPFSPAPDGTRETWRPPGSELPGATDREQQVTTMHFVPSMLQALLATAELKQCASLSA